jgi:hypothetical protein
MIQFASLFANSWAHVNRYRQSMFSGFRTFLPLTEQADTFTRSGS